MSQDEPREHTNTDDVCRAIYDASDRIAQAIEELTEEVRKLRERLEKR